MKCINVYRFILIVVLIFISQVAFSHSTWLKKAKRGVADYLYAANAIRKIDSTNFITNKKFIDVKKLTDKNLKLFCSKYNIETILICVRSPFAAISKYPEDSLIIFQKYSNPLWGRRQEIIVDFSSGYKSFADTTSDIFTYIRIDTNVYYSSYVN